MNDSYTAETWQLLDDAIEVVASYFPFAETAALSAETAGVICYMNAAIICLRELLLGLYPSPPVDNNSEGTSPD